MALDYVQGYGLVEDGLVGYVPRYPIKCGLSEEEIDQKVNEALDKLQISDDEVSLNGKTMKDDYVKGGKYNSDGTATLNIGEDKTATIEDLPVAMTSDEVNEMLEGKKN